MCGAHVIYWLDGWVGQHSTFFFSCSFPLPSSFLLIQLTPLALFTCLLAELLTSLLTCLLTELLTSLLACLLTELLTSLLACFPTSYLLPHLLASLRLTCFRTCLLGPSTPPPPP